MAAAHGTAGGRHTAAASAHATTAAGQDDPAAIRLLLGRLVRSMGVVDEAEIDARTSEALEGEEPPHPSWIMAAVKARLAPEQQRAFEKEFLKVSEQGTPYLARVMTLLANLSDDPAVAAIARAPPTRPKPRGLRDYEDDDGGAAVGAAGSAAAAGPAPGAPAPGSSRIPRPGGSGRAATSTAPPLPHARGRGDTRSDAAPGGSSAPRSRSGSAASGGSRGSAGSGSAIPDDLRRALDAVRVSGASGRTDGGSGGGGGARGGAAGDGTRDAGAAAVSAISESLDQMRHRIGAAGAAAMRAPMRDGRELDQSLLKYGSSVMLRAASAGRCLAVDESGREVDGTGCGVAHASEVFTLLNVNFREDRGPLLVGDEVALRSHLAGDKYLSVDASTGDAVFRRAVIGSAERWSVMAVPDDEAMGRGHAGTFGAAGAALTTSGGLPVPTRPGKEIDPDGMVRSGDALRLRSSTGLLLQLTLSPDGGSGHIGLGTAEALPGRRGVVSTASGAGARLAARQCLDWHMVDARTAFVPQWARSRPFLTGQALLLRRQEEERAMRAADEGATTTRFAIQRARRDAHNSVGGSSATPAAPLASFPPSAQEILLVEDLLYALLGIEGKYVRLRPTAAMPTMPHSTPSATSGARDGTAPVPGVDTPAGYGLPTMEDVQFVLIGDGDATTSSSSGGGGGGGGDSGDGGDSGGGGGGGGGVDTSLTYLASRVLPLARHYVRTNWFVERRSRPESGLVGQALAAAARLLLREYTLLVAKLEHAARNGNLSLQKLWFFVQPSLRTLASLDDVLYAAPHATGGALLNAIHECAARSGDAKARSLARYLLERASEPYLRMLERWVFHGAVDDPFREFMVRERAEITKETMRDDFNATYWDQRYTVREEQVPAFLARHTEVILDTGKYLNVLRECGAPPACPFAQDIVFSEDERHYGAITLRVYEWASRTVMEYLLESTQLLARMTSLKNYLLLHHGDFLVHFMELADDELGHNVSAVSLPRLQSLLEMSLRTSMAASDPFKDDLTCVLESTALIEHLAAINNLGGGAGDSRFVPPPRPAGGAKGSLTGHHVFSLDYKVEWPLSIVFSKRAITKYQLLFRHLFFCKHVERQLCATWRAFQSSKELDLRGTLNQWHVLRQRMLHFMQNLVYYMMNEVLEPRWHEMTIALRKVKNLDELRKVHGDTLDTCLKECLLTNQPLLKILTKLTSLCLLFSGQVQRLMDGVGVDEARVAAATRARSERMGGGAALSAAAALALGVDDDDDDDAGGRGGDGGGGSRSERTAAARRARIEIQSAHMRKTVLQPAQRDMVTRCAGIFDKFLRQFMTSLMDRTSAQYKSHLANLCQRLDYNGFYSAHLKLDSGR